MRTSTSFLCCLLLIAGGLLIVSESTAQPTALDFRIDTVDAAVYDSAVEVSVYLANSVDVVGGFSLWFRLSNPEICSLRTELVTAGTLVEDWSLVGAQVLGSQGNDVKVTGQASPFFPNGGGLQPQPGDTPLFKLLFDVKEPAPVFLTEDVELELVTSPSDLFAVYDEMGFLIGYDMDTVVDTSYWRCLAWIDDICVDWQRVSQPPYDSVEVVQRTVPVLDTSAVHVSNGLVRVPELPCGDFNGDNIVDLSDLIGLVNYLFREGDPLLSRWASNVNGSVDGAIDLSDLVYYVAYLLLGGPPLQCY